MYTPRSTYAGYSGRVDVENLAPHHLVPLPPPPPAVRPAAPAADYNSDSAESLTEIPVAQTRMGSLYGGGRVEQPQRGGGRGEQPQANGNLRYTDTNGNISHKDGNNIRKVRKKRQKPFRPGSGRREGDGGVTQESDSLPLTKDSSDRRNKRHADVPPLDLTSLNGNSDDDGDIVSGGSKRARQQQNHVSQI